MVYEAPRYAVPFSGLPGQQRPVWSATAHKSQARNLFVITCCCRLVIRGVSYSRRLRDWLRDTSVLGRLASDLRSFWGGEERHVIGHQSPITSHQSASALPVVCRRLRLRVGAALPGGHLFLICPWASLQPYPFYTEQTPGPQRNEKTNPQPFSPSTWHDLVHRSGWLIIKPGCTYMFDDKFERH
ncbi:hypothetical protein J6590_040771 [Homalodisca vitripennis]|nr:hypothetical protein J6590_040771 [Homalodisca vitripennis]